RAGREPDLHFAGGRGENGQLEPAGPVVALLLAHRPHMADAQRKLGIEAEQRLVRRRLGFLDRGYRGRARRMHDALAAGVDDFQLAQALEKVRARLDAPAEVDRTRKHEIDPLFSRGKREAARRFAPALRLEALSRALERLD